MNLNDGGVMIQGCFAASGFRRFAILELYKQILQENAEVSICELQLNRKWFMP